MLRDRADCIAAPMRYYISAARESDRLATEKMEMVNSHRKNLNFRIHFCHLFRCGKIFGLILLFILVPKFSYSVERLPLVLGIEKLRPECAKVMLADPRLRIGRTTIDQAAPLADEMRNASAAPSLTYVSQGKSSEISDQPVRSNGFATCHLVLARDRNSKRTAIFHVWEGMFGDSKTLFESFWPDDTDIVVFGNASTANLTQVEAAYRRRFAHVRAYQLEDEGRWDILYQPSSDSFIYSGTDSSIFRRFRGIFGEAADAEQLREGRKKDRGLLWREWNSIKDGHANEVANFVNSDDYYVEAEQLASLSREECLRIRALWSKLAFHRRALVEVLRNIRGLFAAGTEDAKKYASFSEISEIQERKALANLEATRSACAP